MVAGDECTNSKREKGFPLSDGTCFVMVESTDETKGMEGDADMQGAPAAFTNQMEDSGLAPV